jgi:translation initiation factor IF-2
MKLGVMASINQTVDYETASIVAREFGWKPRPKAVTEAPKTAVPRFVAGTKGLEPRAPVVAVMGHVDHGKTSLLDAIRKTEVAAGEAGGITQHIGAYQVRWKEHPVTFLDTPGHEAFTQMRARGAKVTDIVVLVVAADEGVMPQTVEAIDHIKAAGVPLIVAMNKMDKPGANPDRVKQQLAERGLVPEDWGGDIITVPCSAKTRQGLDDLLENILLVAEMAELKANPAARAEGAILEAELDPARGPKATLLVHNGSLKEGDIIVAGEVWGRVRAMFNVSGRRIKRAEPATPAEVLGWNGVPRSGVPFRVMSSEKEARSFAEETQRQGATSAMARAPSLSELYQQIKAGQVKELNVILKSDVYGTLESIRTQLERLGTSQVKVRVLHAGTGKIVESDVMLALASQGVVIGFNTDSEPGADRLARAEGVDIRRYDVIYKLTEDVDKALKGLLEPTYEDVVDGHAEVRAVFSAAKVGKAAGVWVTEGKIVRNSQARVLRGGKRIHEGKLASLRRFKEDAREVAAGYEAGLAVEGFNDYQVGDVIEVYHKERKG